MPVIEIHLLEGYEAEEHQRLGEALTDATRLVVPAPAEAITVMIHELPTHHYYRGRATRTPAAALPNPVAVVQDFLECLTQRDLEAASHRLADNFTMQFPGGVVMQSLDELVQWSKSRYARITKTFSRIEAFGAKQGQTIVYCDGFLSGDWLDGQAFEGIRFIDRFELVGGKITRQEVWNDLAEAQRVLTS